VEGKILIWDTVQSKGWEGPGLCYLCNQDSENIYHLFQQCSFTKSVWDKVIIDQGFKNRINISKLIFVIKFYFKKFNNKN
jgi:hypothetical protein